MKHLVTLSIALLLPAALQAAEEPPPEPPLLAEAPNPGHWTITTFAKSGDDAASQRRQVTVEKSGSRRQETTTSALGGKSVVFFINGFSFRGGSGLAPGDVFVQVAPAPGDFPKLSWIKAGNFAGTRRENGKTYHVYAWSPPILLPPRHPGEAPRPPESGPKKGARIEAWIDAKTRLPARVITKNSERVYEFLKPSSAPLEPSGDVRRRVELYFDGKIPE